MKRQQSKKSTVRDSKKSKTTETVTQLPPIDDVPTADPQQSNPIANVPQSAPEIPPQVPPISPTTISTDPVLMCETPSVSHLHLTGDTKKLFNVMYKEINNLRQEKNELQSKLENNQEFLKTSRLNPEAVTGDDKKCQYFTGLASGTFNHLCTFLKSSAPTKYISTKCLSLEYQLCITLVKLCHNIPFEYLSHQTGFAKSTICDFFWKMVDLLHAKIDFLIHWPDREVMRATLPPTFKASFPRLTGIMDCFEIFIDRPKNLIKQELKCTPITRNIAPSKCSSCVAPLVRLHICLPCGEGELVMWKL